MVLPEHIQVVSLCNWLAFSLQDDWIREGIPPRGPSSSVITFYDLTLKAQCPSSTGSGPNGLGDRTENTPGREGRQRLIVE